MSESATETAGSVMDSIKLVLINLIVSHYWLSQHWSWNCFGSYYLIHSFILYPFNFLNFEKWLHVPLEAEAAQVPLQTVLSTVDEAHATNTPTQTLIVLYQNLRDVVVVGASILSRGRNTEVQLDLLQEFFIDVRGRLGGRAIRGANQLFLVFASAHAVR